MVSPSTVGPAGDTVGGEPITVLETMAVLTALPPGAKLDPGKGSSDQVKGDAYAAKIVVPAPCLSRHCSRALGVEPGGGSRHRSGPDPWRHPDPGRTAHPRLRAGAR